MCLEVHLGIKYDEFLFHAFSIIAQEVISFEVFFKGVVVHVVMGVSRVPTITNEAALVFHAAVLVQLVVIVKSFTTETAQWVALEARLVGSTRLVVSMPHVLLKLFLSEELMLVREHLLVPSAQVAHTLTVSGLHMTVEIRPAESSEVA